MTITHLTKSDSGQYRCGLGRELVPDKYTDFEVRVVDGEFLLKVIKPDICIHLTNLVFFFKVCD